MTEVTMRFFRMTWLCFVFSFPAHSITLNMSGYPASIVVSGDASKGTLSGPYLLAYGYGCFIIPNVPNPIGSLACASFQESGTVNGIQYLNNRGYTAGSVGRCPASLDALFNAEGYPLYSDSNRRATEIMITYVSSLLPLRLQQVATNVPNGGTDIKTDSYYIRVLCGGYSMGRGMGLDFVGTRDIEVENPPGQTKSVCSIVNDLSFTFNSTSLIVAGMSQSKNLTIACTGGTPSNYTLRMTGANVSNGRLNFSNGVSAQMSINGSSIAANGTGIAFNELTSTSVSVSASLVGTASGPGVTNANGILVLEAL
jgi:hypothetical protein